MVLPKYVSTFTYPNGERVTYPFKSKEGAIQFLRMTWKRCIWPPMARMRGSLKMMGT